MRDASKQHVEIYGHIAYHLALNNRDGYTAKVIFPKILTGVRMKLHPQRDCWLLNSEDYAYVEKQMQRWSKYHNGTAAERKKEGEWKKDVRKDHDRLKTKVGVDLA